MKTWEEIRNTDDLNELTPLEYCIWWCAVGASKETSRLAAKELEELHIERKRIAETIGVQVDGEVPDNLADHVKLLMLQEYYPMREEIDRQRDTEARAA